MYIPEVRMNAPVELGPPSRIFREFWRNWRVRCTADEKEKVLAHGVRHFTHEYASTPDRMGSISDGSVQAFGQDYPKLSNESNANLAARFIIDAKGKLDVLEFGTGSGNTIKALHRSVVSNAGGLEWQKVQLCLVEPSAHLLSVTSRDLQSQGIDNTAMPLFSHQLAHFLPPASLDLVLEVAANHYPDPSLSFNAVFQVLKAGGLFIFSEWCYSVTEFPERYRGILEALQWDSKSVDLEKFDSVFGVGTHRPSEPQDDALLNANTQFKQFYVQHVMAGIPYRIFSLKGHCPLQKNVEYLRRSGFVLESPTISELLGKCGVRNNPHKILGSSEMLCTFVAQKRAGQSEISPGGSSY